MITSFFSPKRKGKDNGGAISEKGEKAKNAKRIKTNASDLMKGVSDPSTHVQNLLSHLSEESWKNALIKYASRPSFSSLAKFVESERTNKQVYPPPSDTFTALNLVPFHKVKVVIVGQDPYHGAGQGHGLAFSVRKGVKIPPSLRNIYKEVISNDCGLNVAPKHGCLERWSKQGVLLLNSVLTVRKGEPFSHAKKGWEDFTDEIIRLLLTKRPEDSGRLVFLLWGKPAAKKAETIINRHSNGLSGNKRHVVICSSHPSPLGATKTKAPFIGSKCFSRANSALIEGGLEPIDWNVDGNIILKSDCIAEGKEKDTVASKQKPSNTDEGNQEISISNV